ncbi:XrtA/PEP-CTERM system histidine kinase PrsK [Geobacter sp. SVR]|uniref:XrtA/PEP-CTERM system histidine kinase PrsK n=1 Tax=Geobacter sp. SVR TaxID=2495594 RepID=UPI00143EFD43|nr:XrtA/PEP-CTERM system histidine kinase PrsK [Geobacter sp. SVR]BCS54946.1 histidine kinase [Geobacter sp. SVR]GCF86145.1 histidine kinase [Geobacter sp. SVR]
MTSAISITAIVTAMIFSVYSVVRRDRLNSLPTLPCALCLAAALELFDLLALSDPEQVYFWKRFSLVTEALLPPVLLWFSLSYIRQTEFRSISLPLRLLLTFSPFFAGLMLLIPIDSLFYSPDFASERTLFLGSAGMLFYTLIMLYLVIPLINLEMTLVHTNVSNRWKIKLELLAAGAYISVLIIYYSQALLFRTINMDLTTARALVLIVAVALMAYSRLRRGTGARVYVARQMVYKSVVLLAVGLYLIALGLAGEGVKHFGDAVQRALAIAAGLLGGLALLIVLFSETVKRRIKIFINKNFYTHKYDYRNQWLQFTDRLSSSQSGDDLLRSMVMGFCETFGMGSGGLFIASQEGDSYHLAVGISMEAPQVAFSGSNPGIEAMFGSSWIVDLRGGGTTGFERHRDFLARQDACFIIPFFMREGLDGFIILGRPLNSNEIYNYEDFDLMRALAGQASLALLNLRLSDQLARSREMAAIGKVSAFVMHDLKNLVSATSMMLDNAQDHIAVPAFQRDLLASLGSTVAKMKAMITRLKHLPEKRALQRAPVDLLQLARETAGLVKGRRLHVTGMPVIAEVDREELQKVALNLMLNAVEATDGQAPVTVEVGESDAIFFTVKDRGCGIPVEFIRHAMFVPFMSTKKKGLGIGLYQSKQIVEAHGGRIEVSSTLNKGSEFTIWLPKPPAALPETHVRPLPAVGRCPAGAIRVEG